jgi:transposase
MSGKRYSEEFKIEADRQGRDRGYKVSEVAGRLGITTKSLYDLSKRYGNEQAQNLQISDQQKEICRLKAHRDEHGIQAMCRVLSVELNGYYAWLKQPESARAIDDRCFLRLIKQ